MYRWFWCLYGIDINKIAPALSFIITPRFIFNHHQEAHLHSEYN